MTDLHSEIFEDTFHACALVAFVETARSTGGPPNMEATRLLAFRYYEAALKERRKS
jgi:hypothetical protein